jgi:hypothetical protein
VAGVPNTIKQGSLYSEDLTAASPKSALRRRLRRWMNFQDILKRRLQDIHGFAGGNLEDQLAQNPQMVRDESCVLNPYRHPQIVNDGPPVEGTPEWQRQ